MLGPVLGELIPKANRIWSEGKFYLLSLFLFSFNHISSRSEFSPFPAPCPGCFLITILLPCCLWNNS